MKALLTLGFMAFALSTTPVAAQNADAFPACRVERIRANIARNLEHPLADVRANTIQLIIDLKKRCPFIDLDFAAIPLLRTLKSDERDEIRMLAAVALYRLGVETGHFAIARRAEYDDSARVRRHCARLHAWWGVEVTSAESAIAFSEKNLD